MVDGAELGLGLVPPGDVPAAHVHCPEWCGSGSRGVRPMRSKSSGDSPNSRQHFLVGNDLSACCGGAGLGDVAGLFFAHRLVVIGRVGQGAETGSSMALSRPTAAMPVRWTGARSVREPLASGWLRSCHRGNPCFSNPEPQPGISQSWSARRAAHRAAELQSVPCGGQA